MYRCPTCYDPSCLSYCISYRHACLCKHHTLHQCIEGVYWWQVGCYGNVLIPPRCLDVHSNSSKWHVSVKTGHHTSGEGHISQIALTVITTRIGCRERVIRHVNIYYSSLSQSAVCIPLVVLGVPLVVHRRITKLNINKTNKHTKMNENILSTEGTKMKRDKN